LTFGLVSLAPPPHGRQKWALIPATVLLVIGLLIALASMPFIKYLWPLALILVGLYLILNVLGLQRRR